MADKFYHPSNSQLVLAHFMVISYLSFINSLKSVKYITELKYLLSIHQYDNRLMMENKVYI